MTTGATIGVHGKLPAHGDFIKRNLPANFVEAWDHWLQQSLLASQSNLADAWLDHFLVSPIWRFAIPVGALDSHAWAGLIMPSVDKVGRYFPLTLCSPIPQHFGVFEFMSNATAWYEQLETQALLALEEALSVDALSDALSPLSLDLQEGGAEVASLTPQRNLQHRIPLGEESAFNSLTPLVCDALLKPYDSTLSIWMTAGGQRVEPAVLFSDKLPRPMSYTAMLNGQWDQWHWPSLVQ